MKTVKQIIAQNPVFLNEWTESLDVIASFEDIYLTGKEYRERPSYYDTTPEKWEENKREFENAIQKHNGEHILFASYGTGSYEGEAWVLFEKDGELYEVNASHCSCYGLENQWEPEETILEAIRKRLIDGQMGDDPDNPFANELKEFLGINKESI